MFDVRFMLGIRFSFACVSDVMGFVRFRYVPDLGLRMKLVRCCYFALNLPNGDDVASTIMFSDTRSVCQSGRCAKYGYADGWAAVAVGWENSARTHSNTKTRHTLGAHTSWFDTLETTTATTLGRQIADTHTRTLDETHSHAHRDRLEAFFFVGVVCVVCVENVLGCATSRPAHTESESQVMELLAVWHRLGSASVAIGPAETANIASIAFRSYAFRRVLVRMAWGWMHMRIAYATHRVLYLDLVCVFES